MRKMTSRQQVILEAKYYIVNNSTIRTTAEAFDISKTTVHRNLTKRLPNIDMTLYLQVLPILKRNLTEAHIRGGIATKQKFLNLKAK